MSALPQAELPEDPARHVRQLRELVRQATALGAQFRFAGAEIDISYPEAFPASLRTALEAWNAKGWLYPYLGGERRDTPAVAFLQALGVTPLLVVTRGPFLRIAVATIEHDLQRGTRGEPVNRGAQELVGARERAGLPDQVGQARAEPFGVAGVGSADRVGHASERDIVLDQRPAQ